MLDVLLAMALASATSPAPPPTQAPSVAKPPPVDCRDDAHRALDFWLGDWQVVDTASGVLIAHSRIELIAGGCAIRETFTQTVGPGNQPIEYQGTSYSALNAADNTWRQMYVDNQGAALSYIGAIDDGKMVITARAAALGTRMTVSRQSDGSVRQSGEATKDDGISWTPGYDFTYRHGK